MPYKEIRKVLFDTSFLLNGSPDVDMLIKTIRKDKVSCYISSTIQSELEYLYYMGRLSKERYNKAISRYKKAGALNIEDPRNFLQESVTKECTLSMNEEHGVDLKDVRNDCNILTSGLNNKMDLILSEDFHFTSKHSDRVVDNVCNKTCDRFHKLCECDILMVNKDTFLAAYNKNQVDLDVVTSMKQDIRKDSKTLKDRSNSQVP